jgi:hypothetical protein
MAATASTHAVAAEAGRALRGFGPAWVPLPAERLAGMRGGFRLASGLHLSFGVERVVYVDGRVVAATRVSIPDVSKMTPGEAQALAGLQRTTLVQVGGGNTYRPIGGGQAVVVQNTLDGRAIQVTTTLDVGIGTLGLFQQYNATAAMQAAFNSAPGGP